MGDSAAAVATQLMPAVVTANWCHIIFFVIKLFSINMLVCSHVQILELSVVIQMVMKFNTASLNRLNFSKTFVIHLQSFCS